MTVRELERERQRRAPRELRDTARRTAPRPPMARRSAAQREQDRQAAFDRIAKLEERAARRARRGAPPPAPPRRRPPKPVREKPLRRLDEHSRHKRKAASRAKASARRRNGTARFVPGVFRAGRPRVRLLTVLFAAIVVFGLILARIAVLQTTDAKTYTLAGAQQRTHEQVLQATRGVIFDRNGDELALSVPAVTIFVNPKLVLDPVGTAAALATALDLTPERQQALATAMSDKTKAFVYVVRQIDKGTASTVLDLKLNGVSSYTEDTRVVPGGELARGVIGKTDTDGVGIAGLEKQYNDILTGKNGELVQEHDTNGNAIPGSGSVSIPAVPGTDLVLTLDRSIQFSLEQALLTRVSTLGAKGGTAIVMEAGTGNILAMASVQRSDDGTYHVTSANLAAVACQEPGSVAKVITTSGALNEQLITPESTFDVPGYIIYDKGTKWEHTIRDAEPHKTETMTVRDILVHSSNIGTIKESELLGPERQWDYMTSFGLGQVTALDFPSETAGLLKPWQKWQGTENVSVAYGYGICATAVQLAAAVNVVANNGVYVAPRLVSGTIGADGKVVDAPPAATHTVIRPEIAQEMNQLMQAVVCEGTGEQAQVKGLTVAGKTGTGVKAVNGKYGKEGVDAKYYSSFVGFFPAEKPAVTTLISIDEPPDGDLNHFGGTAAAPVFQALVPTVLHQLGVQPPTDNGGCPKK
jgi:cell division protein FtsI (penicillin-binding protein 3)